MSTRIRLFAVWMVSASCALVIASDASAQCMRGGGGAGRGGTTPIAVTPNLAMTAATNPVTSNASQLVAMAMRQQMARQNQRFAYANRLAAQQAQQARLAQLTRQQAQRQQQTMSNRLARAEAVLAKRAERIAERLREQGQSSSTQYLASR